MTRPRIFLSGPMSGYPGENKQAFNAEAARLRAMGYEVENPADLDIPGGSWADYMRLCLPMLCRCQWVATLPDWEKSAGAWLEHSTASALGMQSMPVESVPAPMQATDWAAA